MIDNRTSVDPDDAPVVNGKSEQSSTAEPSDSDQVSPVVKKPNIFKRFFAFLFNPDTSLGRFSKSFLRFLVAILVLFAAGVLVTFFVLYSPTKAQLTATTATLKDTTAQLNTTVATLEKSDAALADMTTAYDQLSEDYAYTSVQNQLLRVNALVVNAQLLINEKSLVTAKKDLAEARTLLDTVLPEMKKLNAEDADRLDARLDLVISEFGNDVKAAESDLAVLVDWLKQYDQLLQTAIDK